MAQDPGYGNHKERSNGLKMLAWVFYSLFYTPMEEPLIGIQSGEQNYTSIRLIKPTN